MTKSFRVFYSLQQAYRQLFRAADGIIKSRENIVTAHQVVLLILARNDGLKASEIAERAGLSRSRLTGLLDTLAARNLIRRSPDATDGRVQRIFLKPDGQAIIKRSTKWINRLNAELLQPFSSSEREIIEKFLQHIIITSKSLDTY